MIEDKASELELLGRSMEEVLCAECDRRAVHGFVDGANRLDERLWRLAAELGWLGVGLPESSGGSELGAQGLALLHQSLGAWVAPGPFIATLAAAQALMDADLGESASRMACEVAAGELRICIPGQSPERTAGFTFANGRIDGVEGAMLGAIGSRAALIPAARPDGSRIWACVRIDGTSARLDARTSWDRTRQLCRLTCAQAAPSFLIDRREQVERFEAALETCVGLSFAFDSLGAARSILDQTIAYMKTREQFGKPIAALQALKHRVANLHAQTELARVSAAQAAALVQERSPDALTWVWLAKELTTETLATVAAECVQLHGGVGHTWEFDCHLFLKRGRLNQELGSSGNEALDRAAVATAGALACERSTMELPV